MFKKIFIENDLKDHPDAMAALKRFPAARPVYLERYDEVWGKVKRPYLQKRVDLNLFIAKKRGQLVKEAPNAYGVEGEKHFYFVHAYNCIYECEYCYLQGYFNTPDVVIFLNHEDIKREMKAVLDANPNESVWFHAGEFSDSLALSHITGELEKYWDFFKENPRAKLELRTKSVNISRLKELEPLENIYASFSISPSEAGKYRDRKTPPTKARIRALKELSGNGHKLGLHFDPVIYKEGLFEDYEELFQDIEKEVGLESFNYFSLGVVRFTDDVFRQTKKNYPNSPMFAAEFTKTDEGIVRYPRPMRTWILSHLKERLIMAGAKPEKIYLCMEG